MYFYGVNRAERDDVHLYPPPNYSPDNMGLLDPATSDGRVIFFLPWEKMTIAGTTDTPTEVTAHPIPMEDDINFILNEVRNYLSPDVEGNFTLLMVLKCDTLTMIHLQLNLFNARHYRQKTFLGCLDFHNVLLQTSKRKHSKVFILLHFRAAVRVPYPSALAELLMITEHNFV